ncbi:MAG TPA: ATP-binding cassette domain-containing protein [Candidatus Dormibacteraeota bacterium]|nr:ATP-binding cassette domain-containing protein [Candidatus Dormibacteraeota bacterium]
MTSATDRDAAIVTRKLGKRFGRRTAVDGLDINVPRGTVCGFVGPNASGKTTTIRILLGLVRPTAGTARVLGSSIDHPRAYLPRVGALIEGPAFYPSLSGRKNLEALARLGSHDLQRAAQLLDLVGLSERGDDRESTYSMGMKQRLGIAGALLPDPDLLLLDEPTNGLDPQGIQEIRELMCALRDQGKTLFVSSHILAEVEQVADWLVILKDGRALFCGPAQDVSMGRSELVAVPEERAQLAVLARIVQDHGFTFGQENGSLRVQCPVSFAPRLNRLAAQAGVTLVELRTSQASLEETFFELIGGKSDASLTA